jgi:hypothetical protein
MVAKSMIVTIDDHPERSEGCSPNTRTFFAAIRMTACDPPSAGSRGSSRAMSISDRRLVLPLCVLTCVVSVSLTGCESRFPKTVPVSGKVTWQGRPLPDGMVAFIPTTTGEGHPTRSAGGEIGAEGTYRLSSYRPNDGAQPGEYRVTVTSYSSRSRRGDVDVKQTISRIPERYGKPSESGLTFRIPAEARGPLTFDIDLK